MANELEAKMKRMRIDVEDESVAINNMVDSLVAKYGRDLERAVEKVRDALSNNDKVSNEDLEKFVMEVPVHMYFALEGLEKLGIEGDNAKMMKKTSFNSVYIDTPGTIEDKTKQAELSTLTEHYVEIAYQRAYKKLKEKIAKAELVYSGSKKVLDKRTQEIFLTKTDRFN
jgi:D-hexose-6-phosphate mutarotase